MYVYLILACQHVLYHGSVSMFLTHTCIAFKVMLESCLMKRHKELLLLVLLLGMSMTFFQPTLNEGFFFVYILLH